MKKLLILLLFYFLPCSIYTEDYTADANCQIGWQFDAGSGTTVEDETANNRDGTFKGTGEPAWGTSSPPTNYPDGYVDYDDNDDYINAADNTAFDFIDNDEDFTVYFCIDISNADAYNRFIVKQIGTTGDGWQIVDQGNGYIAFVKEESGTQLLGEICTKPAAGTWREFFVQWNNATGEARSYIDKSAGTWLTPLSGGGYGWGSNGKLAVGGREGVAGYSTGSKVAAFALWNRLLSTGEMDDISDNGLGVGEALPAAAGAASQILILDDYQ